MKKIYFSICGLIACCALTAQVAVTFNVDMTGQTVSENGVHIAGNFNDPDEGGTEYPADYNAAYQNWNPGSVELTDDDLDGIYSVTMMLLPARYEFKFINNNVWDSGVENIPSTCQATDGNREVFVEEVAVDYSICWSMCSPCGTNAVRFRVDMSTQPAVSPAGVHVAGDFQDPVGTDGDWNPATFVLHDPDGNNIWEGFANVGTMTSIEFKYINGNDWANPNENMTGLPCGNDGGNRVEAIDGNTTLPVYCWNACDPCTNPAAVTFAVDMSNQTVSADGVHMAGEFGSAGYPQWDPAGIELTDANADNIYEVTLDLPAGTYQYKFVNGNAWGSDEAAPTECAAAGGSNREVVVTGSDPITAQNCFGQCAVTCVQDPDPALITFYVDMTGIAVSPDGVRLIGSFTTPSWQGGQITMTESSTPNVWETTVLVSGPAEFFYKFVNGIADSGDESNSENMGLADCGSPNGIGGYNRVHTRTGETEVLPGPCFDTCLECFVGVEENASVVSALRVFPVPATDVLNMNFTSAIAQPVTMTMSNNMGQVVISEYLGTVSGQRTMRLDTSALASGIYNIALSNDSAVQTVRVVVR
jgi:hypothetical protein